MKKSFPEALPAATKKALRQLVQEAQITAGDELSNIAHKLRDAIERRQIEESDFPIRSVRVDGQMIRVTIVLESDRSGFIHLTSQELSDIETALASA